MDSSNNNNNNTQQQAAEPKKRNNYRRRHSKKPAVAAEDASNSQEKIDSKRKEEKKTLKGFKKKPKDEEEEEEAEDGDGGKVCFICTRPIDYYAVASCDHRTCHMCTLRLRVLYNTKNCAYCKTEAKRVVFTNDGEKPFENYKRDDTPFYDKKYGIRFETEEMYKDTMVILQFNCPQLDCEEAFESVSDLKKHVKQAHKKVLCDFCLRNKKIFSHEHTLYTTDQLQKHYREGDGSFNKDDETGFTGHPECVFCKTRFYGADELFEHCRDKHEQCHLCVRNGVQHQYYANYDNLEKHFKKEHFLCQYKECLDNKFVVFDSDIDLKAHEVNEHGNALSRQQRAKQSRVDVNLNYGNNPRRPPQQHQQQQRSQPVSLSAADFPDINGSTATPLISNRLAHIQLSEQEQWPMLGEETGVSSSGRSSPSELDAAIVSRHAATLDRVAEIFKNFDKVVKFRQLTTKYTSLSIDANNYVDSIFDLCNKDAKFTAKILNGAKDLVDNRTLKSGMVQAWNQKSNNSNGDASPRVLVVNIAKQKKKAGVWDKVASAAVDAGAVRSTVLPMQSKTAWSGAFTPKEEDLSNLFPALPTASSSRRADINSMIKKSNRNAWGESSSSSVFNTTDSEASDNNEATNKKKKGKRGKQVLFRVGL